MSMTGTTTQASTFSRFSWHAKCIACFPHQLMHIRNSRMYTKIQSTTTKKKQKRRRQTESEITRVFLLFLEKQSHFCMYVGFYFFAQRYYMRLIYHLHQL